MYRLVRYIIVSCTFSLVAAFMKVINIDALQQWNNFKSTEKYILAAFM